MNRNQFIGFFFIVLLVFVVYQVFLIFFPFFTAIFWSAILTFGFYPVYVKLRRLFGRYDTLAAIAMTALIFLVVVPPVIFLIINLTAQAVELYQSASDYVRQGNLEKLITQIRSLPYVQHAEARLGEWELLSDQLSSWLLGSSRSIGNFAASQLAVLTKNVFFITLNIFFMSFLTFIFLKDGEIIYNFIYQIAPLSEENKAAIFRQINETFAAVIRGQLLTALAQSIAAGVIFLFLGVPLPIFFATLIFFASLIPVLGASTIWVPLSIYLASIGHQGRAIALFLFGALFISLIDNIIKPALIGEKTRLPYFMLFFGILGGIKVYGLIGIFVAPVVLSLFFALAKIYQEKNW